MLDDENAAFLVVVNSEGQFSIWPEGGAIPDGWKAQGQKGSKDECVAHIDATWTDMRPRSLRSLQGTKPCMLVSHAQSADNEPVNRHG